MKSLQGALSVAAAGNNSSTQLSYPASTINISVAAVDEKQEEGLSQSTALWTLQEPVFP
jgi:hypothetical protein